jgi:hypothetical protein
MQESRGLYGEPMCGDILVLKTGQLLSFILRNYIVLLPTLEIMVCSQKYT